VYAEALRVDRIRGTPPIGHPTGASGGRMKLEASKRAAGAAGALRRTGRIPAVVYNQKMNESVSVDLKAFDRVFRAQGTGNVIDLHIDGEVVPVLVRAVQMDKRKRIPMHADFFAVTAGQKVTVAVRVELVGTAAGVREGGQLDVQRRDVHIQIVPRLIPNHIEVDVSGLNIGDSLHIRDLVSLLPAEAEILDDLELAVAAVVPPRVAEGGAGADGEPEVIGRSSDE
jgi:large subunit ribosomal protein L25